MNNRQGTKKGHKPFHIYKEHKFSLEESLADTYFTVTVKL